MLRENRHPPSHPRRSPPWSTAWSFGFRCPRLPSPQRREGPRAGPAGAWERTALQPPAQEPVSTFMLLPFSMSYLKHCWILIVTELRIPDYTIIILLCGSFWLTNSKLVTGIISRDRFNDSFLSNTHLSWQDSIIWFLLTNRIPGIYLTHDFF